MDCYCKIAGPFLSYRILLSVSVLRLIPRCSARPCTKSLSRVTGLRHQSLMLRWTTATVCSNKPCGTSHRGDSYVYVCCKSVRQPVMLKLSAILQVVCQLTLNGYQLRTIRAGIRLLHRYYIFRIAAPTICNQDSCRHYFLRLLDEVRLGYQPQEGSTLSKRF